VSVHAITAAFECARSEGRKALLPFLMAGHPTPQAFAHNLAQAGEYADVIEVGVPFSDPLADGPVIQSAAAQALKNGTTLAGTLEVLASRKAGPPVVLMLSVNQVLAGGLQRFAQRAADAGVSGAIIPDLPFEEQQDVREVFTRQGLALVSMLAPTTRHERAVDILRRAQGFAYLISVAGVTGAREGFAPETIEYIKRTAAQSPVPVCVGFGISRPQHIGQLREHADGFIVGSALIRGLNDGKAVREILAPLRAACEAELTTDNQQQTTGTRS
jgi:tryptophan synthase alpha chain